jgi:hypothetical protein
MLLACCSPASFFVAVQCALLLIRQSPIRYTVQFLRESPTYNGLSFTAEQKKARDCVSILRRQIAQDATALCGGSSSRGKCLAQ